MRVLRVLLLVLLVVTIPVRGVMAAALLCPPHAGAQADGAARAAHASTGAAHARHGGMPAAHHDHAAPGDTAGHAAEATPGQDGCNLCSACCSVPPLAHAMPGVPPPHALPAAAYPALSAPAPSFLPDRQERPPRRI